MKYVRFTSHRARQYAFRALGYDREHSPEGFYSFRRPMAPGGCYRLTDEEVERIRGMHLVHFTILRGPYDDLLRCWEG